MSDFIENIKEIEQWALGEINSNWTIEYSIDFKDEELLERVVRDFRATYPLGVFLTTPNYARLLVIKLLDWCDMLSVEHIYFVEDSLKNDQDSYSSYVGFVESTARQLRIAGGI